MAARHRISEARLRESGLRPTRQRVALAELLFAKGDRHLTVEELHDEAIEAGVEGVVILNGKVKHSVLLEILTKGGAGTLLVP